MRVSVDLSSFLSAENPDHETDPKMGRELRLSIYKFLNDLEGNDIHVYLSNLDTVYNATLRRYIDDYGGKVALHIGTPKGKVLRDTKGALVPLELTQFDMVIKELPTPGKTNLTYFIGSGGVSSKNHSLFSWILDENGWQQATESPTFSTISGKSKIKAWVSGVPADKISVALLTYGGPYYVPTKTDLLDFDEPGPYIVKASGVFSTKVSAIYEERPKWERNTVIQPLLDTIKFQNRPVSFRTYIMVLMVPGRYQVWTTELGYATLGPPGEAISNVGEDRAFSIEHYQDNKEEAMKATYWCANRILEVITYHKTSKDPSFMLLGVDTVRTKKGLYVIEINRNVGLKSGMGTARLGNIGYQILCCSHQMMSALDRGDFPDQMVNWDLVGETSYIKDAKVRAVLTPKYKPYRDDLVIRDYTDSDFDDVWAITGWKFPMMEANKYQVKVIDRSGFPVGIIFRGMHLGEA